ncbi:MAG: NAD-dependent epimerase/dehydratase family protein [Gammaproteobacteria bacterium]
MNTSHSFKDATVVVVGGAGFVGSTLCHRVLADAPARLVIVDNLLSADMCNVPTAPNVDFILGSIAHESVLRKLPREANYVFHLATYHGNQSSIADPIADHDNNTLTTLMLFDWIKDFGALRKVVYSSAGCTVAQKTFEDAEATTEDAPVSLYHDSPYQISKIVGEFYGNYYLLRYKLPFVKARFQNVYGPREILGAGRWRGTPATVWRNVTPTFIWKSLRHEALPVENGGIATRDFIFVDDIVEGLVACALRGAPGEVYNLASGVETSILELANEVNALTGNPTAIALTPARPWDRSGKRHGSPDKAAREIGFAARVGLRDGLAKTVQWTRDNEAVIRRCMAQHAWYLPELRGAGA